jgi:nucleotide-binding universal stress UspA family protein
MFQRILLAWPEPDPPARALALARELAEEYAAQLVVCCLGDEATKAQAAVGAEIQVESVSARHGTREALDYAHEHGFDLLVVGRIPGRGGLAGELISQTAIPVLVVAESAAR